VTTDITSRNTPDRIDLLFVGLTTFARQPACPDWDRLDGADDPSGITSLLAARTSHDFIGSIFHERAKRRGCHRSPSRRRRRRPLEFAAGEPSKIGASNRSVAGT
jgi:hypothetical protein